MHIRTRPAHINNIVQHRRDMHGDDGRNRLVELEEEFEEGLTYSIVVVVVVGVVVDDDDDAQSSTNFHAIIELTARICTYVIGTYSLVKTIFLLFGSA